MDTGKQVICQLCHELVDAKQIRDHLREVHRIAEKVMLDKKPLTHWAKPDDSRDGSNSI
ncbi:MAG: hypothetical protein HRF40_05220 [Nitrososphaera sp.]